MALVVLDEARGEVKTRRGEANVGISPPCTMSPRTRPIFHAQWGEKRNCLCLEGHPSLASNPPSLLEKVWPRHQREARPPVHHAFVPIS